MAHQRRAASESSASRALQSAAPIVDHADINQPGGPVLVEDGGMLLSMTGFGEAQHQDDGVSVAVEARTVNSRFFKLSTRVTEGYTLLEPQIEAVVRRRVRRGAVQVNVRVDRRQRADDYRIDAEVLNRYRKQLDVLQRDWGTSEPIPLGSLLQLPGVVDDAPENTAAATDDWPLIETTVTAALDGLDRMRREEGRAMADDLRENCRVATESLEQITRRAPATVEEYRERLRQRLAKALAEMDVELDPSDVIREVALFADRCDISEEIVRLRTHLEQFVAVMDRDDSNGRKLEFLTQEMLRETNTIGSKANDVEIAQSVIEIKTAIERIREMIQNIE
jgi:uncharacterized protein (TIGR00255 family)